MKARGCLESLGTGILSWWLSQSEIPPGPWLQASRLCDGERINSCCLKSFGLFNTLCKLNAVYKPGEHSIKVLQRLLNPHTRKASACPLLRDPKSQMSSCLEWLIKCLCRSGVWHPLRLSLGWSLSCSQPKCQSPSWELFQILPLSHLCCLLSTSGLPHRTFLPSEL